MKTNISVPVICSHSALCSHFVSTMTPHGRFYYSPFMDEKIEAQEVNPLAQG